HKRRCLIAARAGDRHPRAGHAPTSDFARTLPGPSVAMGRHGLPARSAVLCKRAKRLDSDSWQREQRSTRLNFDFSEHEEAFRKDVRRWLETHLPDDLRGRAFASSRADREEVRRLRAWQRAMHEAGYVGMDWPREFGGRGASIVEMVILYQEMARAESPQFVNRGGISMLGPAPKHRGISFLLVDMTTPGIAVRPLRQITGEAEFNEVFFDNVRVPADHLVGRLNEGWSVAITTLAYERDLLTFIRHVSLRNALH